MYFSLINIHTYLYVKSCNKHIIGRQSETELKIIMRATYLENARHRDYDILPEIRRLNQLVIDFCVPRILHEINMYIAYQNDINRLPTPMERGEFSSAKGSRVLEQKSFM